MSSYHKKKQLLNFQKNAKKFNEYSSIQEVIQQYLVNKSGKFNSAVLRQDYFKTSKSFQEIVSKTSFLEPHATFQQRLYCVLHNIQGVPLCSICGNNEATFLPQHNRGFSKTCSSPKCRSQECSPKAIDTKLKKYGMKVAPKQLEKIKERVPEFLVKSKATLKRKYGVDNPSQLPGHKNRSNETMQKNYGVSHITRLPEIQQKLTEDRTKKAMELVQNSNATFLSIEKDLSRTYHRNCDSVAFNVKFKCNDCDATETLTHETVKWRMNNTTTICSNCSQLKNGSLQEEEIRSWVRGILDKKLMVISNPRNIIPPYELDIYIPSKQIAIEYNGMFWHSESQTNTRVDRRYHLSKTEMCKKRGIQLIHIFETDWKNDPEKIKSRLQHILGSPTHTTIYARKCSIEIIDSKTALALTNQWHLQGGKAGSFNVALKYDSDYVSVMTFGIPRYTKQYQWELLRFCSKSKTHIPGGASKLFKFFVESTSATTVVSYANKMWSNGNVYGQLGFEHTHDSAPNYFYWNGKDPSMKLHSRVSFQKHKLKDKLETFDPSLTEAENMFNNGYRRIWDCGNQVWVWNLK